ncbi:MAG: ABC transporter transmembrane domain-containing protein [Verrucomicrobiota bacterium]
MQLAGVFALIILFTFCSLAFPRLTGMVLDDATKPNGWSRIEPLLGFYLGFLLVRSVAQMARNHLIQTTGMRVTCDLRVAIFSHCRSSR